MFFGAEFATGTMFQHTAARRRLRAIFPNVELESVSTHSRPKAAALIDGNGAGSVNVSTHSRPKAAGGAGLKLWNDKGVSTHSRPKAAGLFVG